MSYSYLGDKQKQEIISELIQDLVEGTSRTLNCTDSTKTKHVHTILKTYFDHLQKQLKIANLTYLNLLHYKQENLGLYGHFLSDYIRKAKSILNDQTVDNYLALIEKYLEFIPKDLLNLREKLLAIRRDQLKPSEIQHNIPVASTIDHKLVTFQDVDLSNVINQLKYNYNCQSQIETFLTAIRLSDSTRANLTQLLVTLNEALTDSDLRSIGPKLHSFGSLSNGLATFNSDLDVVLKIESIELNILDYETTFLAMQVIRVILKQKLGLKIDDKFLVPSRRCPIIKLDFSECLPGLESQVAKLNISGVGTLKFNLCDMSIRSMYGYYNSKLLKFFTEYDQRFYEMTMLLKYWAKKIGLIRRLGVCSYGMTLMVVFFLQNTDPVVLPSVERLHQLANKQAKQPIKIADYNFEFCDDPQLVGKSANQKSTPELLVEFFRYYSNFDFRTYGLCIRTGKKLNKDQMYRKNRSIQTDNCAQFRYSNIAIEDPFESTNNVGSGFDLDHFNQWKSAVGNLLSSHKITAQNVVQVLTRELSFAAKQRLNDKKNNTYYRKSRISYDYEVEDLEDFCDYDDYSY